MGATMCRVILADQLFEHPDYPEVSGRVCTLSDQALEDAIKIAQTDRDKFYKSLQEVKRHENISLQERELAITWFNALIQSTVEWEIIFKNEQNVRIKNSPRKDKILIPRKLLSKRRMGFVGNKMFTIVMHGKCKVIYAEFQ